MATKTKKRPADQQPIIDRSPPWNIGWYQTPNGEIPGIAFLDNCPGKIDAEFISVLDAVAQAPPPQFSGGGKWEAMHGEMTGWHEVRLTGPGRAQFRLFCLLENGTDQELHKRGLTKPTLVIITGMRKPWRKTFSPRDYKKVRLKGEQHKTEYPRNITTNH